MQCDAWALGMCLHVMLCGCFPFDSSQEEEELLELRAALREFG